MKEPQFITEGSFIEAAKKQAETKKDKDSNGVEKGIEEEKLAPILIIYRDNDLFAKQVPEITKSFQQMGRKLETKVFPKETSADEIKNWYMQNKHVLEGVDIVSDRTASVPQDMKNEIEASGTKQIENLDSLISKAMSRVLLGESSYQKLSKNNNQVLYEGSIRRGMNFNEESTENIKEFFAAIVRRILSNPNNNPEKVVIFPSRLMDHMNEFGKEIESKQALIEKISEYLIEGGLDPAKLEIGDEISGEGYDKSDYHVHAEGKETLKKFDKPNYWTIADRHVDDLKENISSAILLKMPLGNFYQSAKEQGLLNYTDEELSNVINKTLEEKYSEK